MTISTDEHFNHKNSRLALNMDDNSTATNQALDPYGYAEGARSPS